MGGILGLVEWLNKRKWNILTLALFFALVSQPWNLPPNLVTNEFIIAMLIFNFLLGTALYAIWDSLNFGAEKIMSKFGRLSPITSKSHASSKVKTEGGHHGFKLTTSHCFIIVIACFFIAIMHIFGDLSNFFAIFGALFLVLFLKFHTTEAKNIQSEKPTLQSR